MPDLDIKAIKQGRLSDTVAERLAFILRDKMQPGDSLPSEGDLAEQFGVSKTTIREALRSLATLGVVELQQGRAATVQAPSSEPLERFFQLATRGTSDGLHDAIELRRILEIGIVALAAERVTAQQLKNMESAINKMEKHIGSDEPWLRADLEFHICIARATNNKLMIFQVKALVGLFHESMRQLHKMRGLEGVRESWERHVRIFEAVSKRDADAARQAMQVHFDYIDLVMNETE